MAEKYSFIVVRYPNKDTAEAALQVVLGLAKEKVVKLKDVVALTILMAILVFRPQGLFARGRAAAARDGGRAHVKHA